MKQTIKNILGVKNTQRITIIRKTVQISLFRFWRWLQRKESSLPKVATRTFSLPGKHIFFGYYDVPQFNKEEKLLLATAAPLTKTTPTTNYGLDLGFFDLNDPKKEFKPFASTSTWCWQQGCRLQWYPFVSNETVLYNTLVNEQYGCVIQNIKTGNILKSYRRPIYAISRDGKWGLSLNFSRLQRLRPGYGYSLLPDTSLNDLQPDNDGIWRIDMETNEEQLIFSINDIALLKPDKNSIGAQHYFNHLLFNTNGDRFMFFHLYRLADGSRKIRLFTSNLSGTNICLLNDSGHSSHYSWKNNEHLLCYSTVSGKGEGYYLYTDCTGNTSEVGANILTEDGHPSYIPKTQKLITDTYPDKYGEQSLLLYDTQKENLRLLAKLYSPVKYNGETRCDLHPRISLSGKFVCVDCIIDNNRAMKIFDLY